MPFRLSVDVLPFKVLIHLIMQSEWRKEAGDDVACPNPRCADYGKQRRGQLVKNGTARGAQRLKCKTCGKTFVVTKGSFAYRLRANPVEALEAAHWVLNEGISINETAENFGVKWETVKRWVEVSTKHAKELKEATPIFNAMKRQLAARLALIRALELKDLISSSQRAKVLDALSSQNNPGGLDQYFQMLHARVNAHPQSFTEEILNLAELSSAGIAAITEAKKGLEDGLGFGGGAVDADG
jgi:transposase-like protein